jgi:heme exporter protein B
LTLIFFAFLLVVIFTFSLWVDEKVALAVSPGIIWIALAFTGALAIDRSFAQEQEGDTMTALVLVPGAPQAIFIAKTLTNVVYMLLVEVVVAPLVIFILSVPIPIDAIPCFVASLVVGTVGFAAVGTVFSAMLVSVRRRGVLLPIVLYPVTIPLLVMGVEATSVLVQDFPIIQAWSWVKVMVAVDVLYLLGGLWLFGHITEDE